MVIRRFEKGDAAEVAALIQKTLRISNSKDYPPEYIERDVQIFTPEYVVQRAGWTHFYVVCANDMTWQDYVRLTCLEITCGEAPYLVSRYDVATGESIPLEKRIGLLDRKLRLINDKIETKEEWMEWAIPEAQITPPETNLDPAR